MKNLYSRNTVHYNKFTPKSNPRCELLKISNGELLKFVGNSDASIEKQNIYWSDNVAKACKHFFSSALKILLKLRLEPRSTETYSLCRKRLRSTWHRLNAKKCAKKKIFFFLNCQTLMSSTVRQASVSPEGASAGCLPDRARRWRFDIVPRSYLTNVLWHTLVWAWRWTLFLLH